MSIENDLNRIACALEDLLDHLKGANQNAKKVSGTPSKPKVEKVPEKTSEPEQEPEPVQPPELPGLDYTDVKEAFFGLLGHIRDTVGMAKAKETALELLRKYTNGSPLDDKVLAPENYQDLFDDIVAIREKHGK